MPDYVKIGFTRDLKRRLNDLDTTGVANRKQARSKYGAKRPKAGK